MAMDEIKLTGSRAARDDEGRPPRGGSTGVKTLSCMTVSFAEQKLLSLIRSHLFSSVFISITLVGGS